MASNNHSQGNKPKRPMPAYLHFVKEKRRELHARESSAADADPMPMGEMARRIANMWRELDEAGRTPYLEKARIDKERYEEAIRQCGDETGEQLEC